MNSFLIHGCYDSSTLNTLKNLGTKELAFDLRGRSPNIIPFRDLKILLKSVLTSKVFLTFENDSKETILAFLNLLKDEPFKFQLIFRDCRPAEFYQSIPAPFLWMFNPAGDWKAVLNLPLIKGVLLPVKLQKHFQALPLLWETLEKKNLDVYLHAESFGELATLNLENDTKISLDLTSEIETSFRVVDQDKLKRMPVWRKFNENPAI